MARVATPSTARGKSWLALIGVLAIAIQCLVVQVHVHSWSASAPLLGVQTVDGDAGQGPAASPIGQASDPAPAPAHRHGGQQACFICQTALAGAAILASAPPLSFLERAVLANAAIPGGIAAIARRSHNWQSRAPPLEV